MLVLFTDTDTDVTPAAAEKFGFRLISMPYSVNGETVFPYSEEKEFDFHGFYDMLRGGALPTTSAISTESYLEYFEPEFKNGNDILYVHFSRAMTVTFENMDKAIAILKEKYPERKFYGIDTKGITAISYMIVREIGKLRKKGSSAEDIVKWADSEVSHFAMLFFADDLKFFRRSGRVGGLAATMGTLIGIRPIITMSAEGKMESIGTEKGRRRAVEHLVDFVAENQLDTDKYGIVIGHTDSPEIASQLGEMLKARLGQNIDIEYVCTNPTAGSHCGPDGVGVVFHAIHR